MPVCLFLSPALCGSLSSTLFSQFSVSFNSSPPPAFFFFFFVLSSSASPRAFVWLYFRHQTWRFVTVDTIRSDLQRAPSLWTLAVLLSGWLARTEDTHTQREWKNNDEYLARGVESPRWTRAPDQMRQKRRWKRTKKIGRFHTKIVSSVTSLSWGCPCREHANMM